jgi:hypothetical protein
MCDIERSAELEKEIRTICDTRPEIRHVMDTQPSGFQPTESGAVVYEVPTRKVPTAFQQRAENIVPLE